jgi:hypothetical protein
MSHPIRTCSVTTGEVMVNLNDLIIRLLIMVGQAGTTAEAEAFQKIVDLLVSKRDQKHRP